MHGSIALLVLSLFGCASTARVRVSSVLVVASGPRAEASQAHRALRERIAARDDLEAAHLARIAALAAEDTDDSTEAAEVEARGRVSQAEEAFSRFDYAGATTQLSEALELLRPLARRAIGRARIAEVHLMLAMVLLVHGERDAAVEELQTCLFVDEACAPDPARHPPDMIALYEEVRSSSRDASILELDTSPSGATVWVDGRRVGESPVRLDDVAIGRHYISVARDGFVSQTLLISVAQGAPTSRVIALSLGSPPRLASATLRALESRGAATEPRWRAQAAVLSEADVLMILDPTGEDTPAGRSSTARSSLRISAFDARGAPMRPEQAVQAADLGAVRRYLDAVLPPPEVPWYGQWWFWTPVAVALAAGLATLTTSLLLEPNVRLIGGGVTYD